MAAHIAVTGVALLDDTKNREKISRALEFESLISTKAASADAMKHSTVPVVLTSIGSRSCEVAYQGAGDFEITTDAHAPFAERVQRRQFTGKQLPPHLHAGQDLEVGFVVAGR